MAQKVMHLATVMVELVVLAALSARPDVGSGTHPRSVQLAAIVEPGEVYVALST